LSNKI